MNHTTDMTCEWSRMTLEPSRSTLSGELDITNIETVVGRRAGLEGEPERLVIDVQLLRFADSSAIALWVKWCDDRAGDRAPRALALAAAGWSTRWG